HAGEQSPVPLPGPFRLNITFPLPGTWYYRAHAIVAGQQVWSTEMAITLATPSAPKVILLDPPRNHTIEVGATTKVDPIVVEWSVLTPANTAIPHTDVHHGPASVATPSEAGPQSYPQKTSPQNGTGPMIFRGNVTIVTGFPAVSGSYYMRAMALVRGADGNQAEVWSDEWAIQVTVKTV
ncbi:MAG TPA: hypothetical protein VGR28_04395, partial [Candidatus Thermoplasmatota archaeon]|nr:hypothetical protein [Candidatus Thermoplasmatota archaeon]